MPGSEIIVEVSGGERLLRQVQGLARDQGREADHDEERATRYPGLLPGLWHEDLQDRRGLVPAADLGGRRCSRNEGQGTDDLATRRSPAGGHRLPGGDAHEAEDCGALPVVSKDGKLVGIVTDRDIVIRAVAAGQDPRSTPVSAVMSADPFTLQSDADADDAEKLMAERQVRRLPVVENGRLVGIVVTAHLARRSDVRDVGETIKGISEPKSGRGSHARG